MEKRECNIEKRHRTHNLCLWDPIISKGYTVHSTLLSAIWDSLYLVNSCYELWALHPQPFRNIPQELSASGFGSPYFPNIPTWQFSHLWTGNAFSWYRGEKERAACLSWHCVWMWLALSLFGLLYLMQRREHYLTRRTGCRPKSYYTGIFLVFKTGKVCHG